MPGQGTADFVAYHPDPMAEYVIEGKAEPFNPEHCLQVRDYAQQLQWEHEQDPEFDDHLLDPMPQMALAYSPEYAESIDWDYCKRLDIWILLVTQDTYFDFPEDHPSNDVLLNYQKAPK